MGFFSKLFNKKEKEQEKEKLDTGLESTKKGLWDKISHAVAGRNTIDEEVLDDLEEAFIMSDVGVDTTLKIIDRIKDRVSKDKYVGSQELNRLLCEEISDMLVKPDDNINQGFEIDGRKKPYIILVVGVNGVGKTTTIAKLAYQYQKAGLKVILGAADTFRAAAVEQLQLWGERINVPVIKRDPAIKKDSITKKDKLFPPKPSAVAYETVSAALAQGADVAIIDTAGRLHNRKDLMDELTNIKNSVKKLLPDAPHEVLLVLDGSTGQNAYEQARNFMAATEVNSMAITKLDGTAKGGVVIGISDTLQIPVKYIGIGEGVDDLQEFDAREFVDSLFGSAIK